MGLVKHVSTHLKNVIGWKSNRRIVVFAVDDYGNLRISSKQGLNNLIKYGIKLKSRFDYFDSLENHEDLEMLFDTLRKFKDIKQNNPVFTAFSLPANIDYEKVMKEGDRYYYELLPDSYHKTYGSDNTFTVLSQGIDERLFHPQFHGREHLNVKHFETALKENSKELRICLENRCYTGISSKYFATIKYSSAFDFFDHSEFDKLNEIIEDGLNCFEKVFNFRANSFTPPSGNDHKYFEAALFANGVKYIDRPRIKKEHQGNGKMKTRFYFNGQRNKFDQNYLVRNCQFEPGINSQDSDIKSVINQIETAFYWHSPVIISSHRVNFSGGIDPENRKSGLLELEKLISQILRNWPDVEFLTYSELGDIMNDKK